jgi:hypothetical protein
LSRRRRRHRGGVPRGAAPFVCNRYSMRQVTWLLQCEVKIAYPDRRAALRARDAIYERTGDWMHAYRCRAQGTSGHFHLGHRGRRHLVMRELTEFE